MHAVLLREALRLDRKLVHFPVRDEYTSIVRHIFNSNPSTNGESVHHKHPLTLHQDYPVYNDDDDDDDDGVHRLPTCNACVQFISPPFYTCSQCPKLFLHDCCARLPSFLQQNPIGLHLRLKVARDLVLQTSCCNRFCNGFIFEEHKNRTDVMCALMPNSITYAAHAQTHVLRSSYTPAEASERETCRCCGKFLSGVSYKCTTCRNFSIHATCAWLPATVRHVYDPHPLVLVTAQPPRKRPQMETICDACEQSLDDTWWHYGCADCDQAFHVDCVSCLDQLSLIKYEIAEESVANHKCPLIVVRGHMVRGRRCGQCGEGYQEHRDNLPLACFKCNFSLHARCARTIAKPQSIFFFHTLYSFPPFR